MVTYHVYANSGAGDPIDYATPIATTSALSYTTGPLAFPGSWSFGVRASNANGEEQNLDCAVTLMLDATGKDVSAMPAAPMALVATAVAGGGVKVQWTIPLTGTSVPSGFHVYIGLGSPDYTTPVATVAFQSRRGGVWVTDLTGLADGSVYSVGVRAYSAVAEETNTRTVNVTARTSGPAAVHNLTGTATS
jgi:hypothetical protein